MMQMLMGMGVATSKWEIVIAVLCLSISIIIPTGCLTSSQPQGSLDQQVALFVFGDSLFDPGNNNYINTTTDFQANFWPYGQSYFNPPTGRFSDGRLIPDFIAEYARLPLIPAYLEPKNNKFTHGANFASGGAGALIDTHAGLVVDLQTQLRYFGDLENEYRLRLGVTKSQQLLSGAVYLFSCGGNDYQSFVAPNEYEQYVDMVIGNLTNVVKGIYEKGGRKFGFVTTPLIGCWPAIRIGQPGDTCSKEIDDITRLHNQALAKQLKILEKQLEGFELLIFYSGNLKFWWDGKKQGRNPIPPTAIIPLGTGNDLSRSFGWGGSFPLCWRAAIKKTLDKATYSPTSRLDSWNLLISMPSGVSLDTPHSLKQTEEVALDQDLEVLGKLPEKVSCYQGVFYNYFSIGMDAQVAYGFHHLRNEKPYLARGPISNKIIYSGYSCKQGWFFTPCMANPGLRGLKNILRLHVKRLNSSEWELVPIPSSVRSIVALNLHSYASGRNPWGKLKPEYMDKRGFVEANADDGLLEVFGFKQGWHASFVMVELISAKHIAQAAAIRFELRGGAWKQAFMQMDGEPWKQPLKNEFSTFVDIVRVPFHSVMINGG